MAQPQTNIRAVITAEDHSRAVLDGFANSVSNVGSAVAGTLRTAALAFGAAGAAAASFALKGAADFEQTRIGLENMLGSADKAKSVLADVSKFAADTPFEFPELAQAVRQLVAFGFSAEDGVKTMKQLGDVSAAVGAPINDLAYLMGTLRTQGRAFTVDIRQFAQRGIPIYEYLAKVLNTNEKAISEMIETGKIGFPEVEKAFAAMTGEGGKFHNTMQKQSKSLSGLFSTLKDNVAAAAREFVGINTEGDILAGSIMDRLKTALTRLTSSLQGAAPAAALFADALGAVFDTITGNDPTIRKGQEALIPFVVWLNTTRDAIISIAQQIAGYLGPKLQDLWISITQNLIPVLSRLWKEILQPLIPVIGTALVVALGAVLDVTNLLITAFSGIATWMLDNKEHVIALTAAFAGFYVVLNQGAIITAFNNGINAIIIGMNTLRLITIPSLLTSLAMFGPAAIALGAVAAAFVAIQHAADEAHKAIDGANEAIASKQRQDDDLILRARRLRAEGKVDEARRLENIVLSGQRASGGPVAANSAYLVGERGPEVIVPRTAGEVIPNNRLKELGSNSSPVNIILHVGMFAGTEMELRKLSMKVLQGAKEAAAMKNMTVQELLA